MAFRAVDTDAPSSAEKLVLASWGLPKEGQTTLGFTFPAPIYLFNFNFGYADLVPLLKGKKLYVADYPLPDEFEPITYRRVVTQFRKDWVEACEQAASNGGTVMIDKDTEAWQIIGTTLTAEVREEAEEKARAKDKTRQSVQLDWGKANLMMGNMQKRPFQVGCNAIYTHAAKERYNEKGQPTGMYVMQGFGGTESNVQVVLQMLVHRTASGEQKIVGRIERCRFLGGQQHVGSEIVDPTFDKIMALVA